MKLTINLDELDTGADYDQTVADILRDEIHAIIRSAVKAGLKDERARIQEAVRKAAAKAARDVEGDMLKDITGALLAKL